MLMFDQIIVPLIEYIENNYDINEFKFDITTNGTLLSEERLIFMKKYNISILLSIDGDKETQDYNRPCKDCNSSSFNLVSKNIPSILKYFPDTVFRSTVYKDTIKNLFQNYLYAEEIGFKNYICIPDSRS
jgi:sulfatase maturation enzyme AslB (radical SAM superfamily)